MSLRDRILAAEDRPHTDVEVPEWGVTVRIRAMSGLDRDLWEAGILARRQSGGGPLANMRASLVAHCALDPETGERLFSEDDVAVLGSKAAKPLDRLFSVASDLSGLSDKDVKDLEKK